MGLFEGLIDRVDILEVVPQDSGFGTVEETEVVLASNLRARLTLLTEERKREPSGMGGGYYHKIIIEDTAVLDDETKNYKVLHGTTKYAVIFYKRQRNKAGVWHHVSVVGERE